MSVLGPVTASPEPEPETTTIPEPTESTVPEPTPAPAEAPALIEVRATVNLSKLPTGRVALVDPSVPYIAGCLRRGLLVPVRPAAASTPPDE